MTAGAFLFVDLAAAALLALWVAVRYPSLGPHSISRAVAGFVAGQCAPSVGLLVVPSVVGLPFGLQLAFLGVVLPVFFFMFLTVAWLLRTCAGAIGGPRGGHRVRAQADASLPER